MEVAQDFNLKSGLVDSFVIRLFGATRDMKKMNARGMKLLKVSGAK